MCITYEEKKIIIIIIIKRYAVKCFWSKAEKNVIRRVCMFVYMYKYVYTRARPQHKPSSGAHVPTKEKKTPANRWTAKKRDWKNAHSHTHKQKYEKINRHLFRFTRVPFILPLRFWIGKSVIIPTSITTLYYTTFGKSGFRTLSVYIYIYIYLCVWTALYIYFWRL